MINGRPIDNHLGISSGTMRPIWSYSNDYNYIPNIKNGISMGEVSKTALFAEDKITISTEEKRKTKKGGN